MMLLGSLVNMLAIFAGCFVGVTLGRFIPERFNSAIEKAVAMAKEQGVHGKETTPFLLATIKDITGGDSLDSNIQLVFNNARLAAQTAAELCKL